MRHPLLEAWLQPVSKASPNGKHAAQPTSVPELQTRVQSSRVQVVVNVDPLVKYTLRWKLASPRPHEHATRTYVLLTINGRELGSVLINNTSPGEQASIDSSATGGTGGQVHSSDSLTLGADGEPCVLHLHVWRDPIVIERAMAIYASSGTMAGQGGVHMAAGSQPSLTCSFQCVSTHSPSPPSSRDCLPSALKRVRGRRPSSSTDSTPSASAGTFRSRPALRTVQQEPSPEVPPSLPPTSFVNELDLEDLEYGTTYASALSHHTFDPYFANRASANRKATSAKPAAKRQSSWFSLLKRHPPTSSTTAGNSENAVQLSPADAIKAASQARDSWQCMLRDKQLQLNASRSRDSGVGLSGTQQTSEGIAESLDSRVKAKLSRSCRESRPTSARTNAAAETHWITELEGPEVDGLSVSTLASETPCPSPAPEPPSTPSSPSPYARYASYDFSATLGRNTESRRSMHVENLLDAEPQPAQPYAWLSRNRRSSARQSVSTKPALAAISSNERLTGLSDTRDSVFEQNSLSFDFAQSGNFRSEEIFTEDERTLDAVAAAACASLGKPPKERPRELESVLAVQENWVSKELKSKFEGATLTRRASAGVRKAERTASPEQIKASTSFDSVSTGQAPNSTLGTAPTLALRRGIAVPAPLHLRRTSPTASETTYSPCTSKATVSPYSPSFRSPASPRIRHPYNPSSSPLIEVPERNPRQRRISICSRRGRSWSVPMSPPPPSVPPPPVPMAIPPSPCTPTITYSFDPEPFQIQLDSADTASPSIYRDITFSEDARFAFTLPAQPIGSPRSWL